MRKTLVAIAAAVSLLVVPLAAVGTTKQRGPGPGYFASDNVEWVTNVPLENDTAGARVVGKYMYITTSRDLTIYDVSDPEKPQRLGFLLLPQQPYFAEEDVDTNGKVLLIGTYPNDLYVIDVEDKSNPKVAGQVGGADQHTWSCVLSCKWAYGSEGLIADLRDPANPKVVGNWGEGKPAGSGHDVTEIAPGLVVTSTQPIMFLDARKDPARPKLLAVGANEDQRFIHGNLWPHGGKDRFLLVGGETTGPDCDSETDGAFMTWDTRKWKRTGTFTMIDEYRVTNGLPTDGNAPADLFCTHWFEEHPTYRNGGLVAMAWYEHGTRFLEVSKSGRIKPVGYFVPVGGSTSAAYWLNDKVVYAVDYNRGIDILRFTGKT